MNFDTDPADYYAHANEEVAVILQCEHIQAVRDFDQVFSVPGIDAVFVGPNDLAASMRGPDGKPPHTDLFKETLAAILAGCKRNGVAAGIHTFSVEEAKMRIADGWQFIAVNSELRMMMDGAQKVLDGLGLQKSKNMVKY